MLNVKKPVCSQPDYIDRRQDRSDYHQNTMENARTLDPTECKLGIRHLKGTDKAQQFPSDYSNSFTFFDDIQK